VTSDGQRGSLDALYREFFERGVHYGLPDTHLRRTGSCKTVAQAVVVRRQNGGFDLSWLGSTYELHRDRLPLSDNEMKLLRTIGDVLSARYRVLLNPVAAAERLDLFRGMPEDRYVSAFLEPGPYADGWVAGADRSRRRCWGASLESMGLSSWIVTHICWRSGQSYGILPNSPRTSQRPKGAERRPQSQCRGTDTYSR
jgi:hypothetical protein